MVARKGVKKTSQRKGLVSPMFHLDGERYFEWSSITVCCKS
jgi:hypothetical protein